MSQTQTLAPDADGIARAAALLKDGALVAFPTETVYGLGGDARNPDAVAAIYAAKGRPSTNPLIVHVDTIDTARTIATFDDAAERLAAAFWPGPLTLVLPLARNHGLAPAITAGLPTVAIRIPAADTARAIIAAAATPIAAPSANPSGKVSATDAAHVIAHLSGRIAAVVDGGPCALGVESTIVGVAPDPVLLRPGALPTEMIVACIGPLAERDTETITAPGQLASHYAPRAALRLNVITPDPGEILLGFGPVVAPFNLSVTGDLHEAAATLFATLHALDAAGIAHVAVSPIPEVGIGRAINDRLRRAATPRA